MAVNRSKSSKPKAKSKSRTSSSKGKKPHSNQPHKLKGRSASTSDEKPLYGIFAFWHSDDQTPKKFKFKGPMVRLMAVSRNEHCDEAAAALHKIRALKEWPEASTGYFRWLRTPINLSPQEISRGLIAQLGSIDMNGGSLTPIELEKCRSDMFAQVTAFMVKVLSGVYDILG